MKRRIKCGLFLCAVLLLSSCIENTTSTIPDYPVRLNLNLMTEYAIFRNSTGESLVFEERIKEMDRIGFGGILVCTNYEGKYLAFDLACPYEAKQNVRVKVDGLFADCEECGARFDIYTSEFAFPVKGPTKQGLKKYKTALTPAGILQIYR
jgi:hypothetical protein